MRRVFRASGESPVRARLRSGSGRPACGTPERIRLWWLEGDYSYKIDRLTGNGWIMVGDALRFVDPIFSTGVDVATYSATYAFEAINRTFKGMEEGRALHEYERRVTDDVDAWYDLIALFYKLQRTCSPCSRSRTSSGRRSSGSCRATSTCGHAPSCPGDDLDHGGRLRDDHGAAGQPPPAGRADAGSSASRGCRSQCRVTGDRATTPDRKRAPYA
jgi:hypothetical protein